METHAALPPAFLPQGHIKPAKAPARTCANLAVRINPKDAGRFRALLDSHGHRAYFSVCDPKAGLLRLTYSPDDKRGVESLLAIIALDVPMEISPAPTEHAPTQNPA